MLAPGVRWFDDWFAIEEIAPGITAIGEPRFHQVNWNYLIEGNERALLFDTGPGVRDISVVVRALTGRLVTAMPSHLHFDHVGNLHRFKHIALADLPVLRACECDGVLIDVEDHFRGHLEGMVWTPVEVECWVPIGAMIELGGRRLQLLHTPGHSPDSVSLYDSENRILLSADFLYLGQLYAQVPGSNLRDYLETAESLLSRLSPQTRIFGAHGQPDAESRHRAPELSPSDLADLVNSLQRLRAAGLRPRAWPVNARMTLLASEEAYASWQS